VEVILKEDVANLGERGERVQVARGYARNYLFPHSLAVEANAGNVRALTEETKMRDLRENKTKRTAERMAQKLSGVSVTATVQVGEDEKLFGSVTSNDIEELLRGQGYEIDRKRILLEEPIKALGVYTVPVKLHRDVDASVKVWVVKS
jgi:large subunit ribosomal protein L9